MCAGISVCIFPYKKDEIEKVIFTAVLKAAVFLHKNQKQKPTSKRKPTFALYGRSLEEININIGIFPKSEGVCL